MGKTLVLTKEWMGKSLQTYGFEKDVVRIGRHIGCDVLLDHPGISREHVLIERNGERFQLRDRGSTNGTLVNRRRVHEAQLEAGDVVQIGTFVLRVEIARTEQPKLDPAGLRLNDSATVRLHSLVPRDDF